MYTRATLQVLARLAARVMRAKISGHNPAMLGHAVEAKASSHPDRLAYIFENGVEPEQKITLGKLRDSSHALACELLKAGLKRRDRFAVYARNHPEMLYAFTAASLTGTVAVPIDPRNRGDLLRAILADARPKVLIVADYLAEEAASLLPSLPETKHVWMIHTGAAVAASRDFRPIEDVLSGTDRLDRRQFNTDMMSPFQLIYTSGTTGNPKGVVQPNARYLFMSVLGYFFGYTSRDVLYTGLSLSHGNSQAVTAYPALELGIPAVISRRFTKSRIWDVARQYGVTSFSLLGGMASGIYNEPRRENDADNPVRVVVSAGFPMALWIVFERRFGLRILEWYASVEGGFTYKPIGKGPFGAFGKSRIPGVIEFRIVDEQDKDVAPGETGEIISRLKVGETKVEYHGNSEASENKTRGGWLRSGDIGHMDSKGWMYFDYRKGRSLRRQGDFVPVDFVEKAISDTGYVSDVYVYGVPAESGAPGESDLVAAVVFRNGSGQDLRGLGDSCRASLPANFVPAYFQVLDEIPKTPSEKPRDEWLKSTFTRSAANVFKTP